MRVLSLNSRDADFPPGSPDHKSPSPVVKVRLAVFLKRRVLAHVGMPEPNLKHEKAGQEIVNARGDALFRR